MKKSCFLPPFITLYNSSHHQFTAILFFVRFPFAFHAAHGVNKLIKLNKIFAAHNSFINKLASCGTRLNSVLLNSIIFNSRQLLSPRTLSVWHELLGKWVYIYAPHVGSTVFVPCSSHAVRVQLITSLSTPFIYSTLYAFEFPFVFTQSFGEHSLTLTNYPNRD